MPAKPLTDEQKRDAARLAAAFDLWKSARAERGEPTTQEAVADLFGMGQSALSQYLNAKIPLNAEALERFCQVLGVRAINISPSVVRRARELAAALDAPATEEAPALPSRSSQKRPIKAAA
jgi:transcriptional regulator with XRE-family HTH domain